MRLTPQSSADSPWKISGSQAIWKVESLDAKTELKIGLDGPQQGISLLRYQGKILPGRILGVTTGAKNEDLNWILRMARLRGIDLLVTYQNSSSPQSTLQMDWRISLSPGDQVLLKIGVVISMHTESLESYPHITATTQLACDQFLYVDDREDNTQTTISSDLAGVQAFQKTPDLAGQSSSGLASSGLASSGLSSVDPSIKELASDRPGSAVYRLRELPWSYVEMVYPADFGHWLGSMSANDLSHEGHPHEEGDWTSRWDLGCKLLEKGVIRRLQLRGLLLPRQNDLILARRGQATFAAEKLPLA
jgi:hypothetical protein